MAAVFTAAMFTRHNGGVYITLSGVTAGQRVARVRESGELRILHTNDLVSPFAVYDWEPPIGETATYVLSPNAFALADKAVARINVNVPGGHAYLRQSSSPEESMQIRVISTGTETETARQTLFDISGRREPLVVFDKRAARTGTIQLVTVTRDERQQLEWLLSTGEPVLVNICSSKCFEPCLMAVGDVAWTRVDKYPDRFLVDLSYVEVSSDEWVGGYTDYTPPVRPEQLYSGYVTAGLTYQQVRDQYQRYIHVLDGYKP